MIRDIRWPRSIDLTKSGGVLVGVCITSACLVLGSCTIQSGLPGPTVTIDTPAGPVPLNAPPPVLGSGPGLASPPPGLMPLPAVPAQPINRNGTYSGRADVLSTAGGMCLNGMNVSNFKVSGNSVRFGRFRGTIAQDDGLQMVYRGTWIVGQFEGDTFVGQVDGAGNWDTPGCTFYLKLVRTGP